MKHRILSLALALLMIAAVLPILPIAAEETLPELPATLPGELIADWGSGGSTPGKNKVSNLGMDAASIGKAYTLKDFVAFSNPCHMTINGSKSTTSTTGMKLKTKKLTGTCGIMVAVVGTGNDAGLGMQFAVTVKLTVDGQATSYTYSTNNQNTFNTYVYNTSQLESDGVWAGEVKEDGSPRVSTNVRIPGNGFSGYLYLPFSSLHCPDSEQKHLDEAIAYAATGTAVNPISLEVSNVRCQAAGWTSGASYADIASIQLVTLADVISSVQPILSDNIDFAVTAYAPEAAELTVSVAGGEAQTLAPTVNKDGTVSFRFDGLLPQQMNDEVVMNLTVDGEVADSRTFVFADYCREALKNRANAEALNTLFVDLLNYGAESQKYAGYRTDALANAALTDSQKKLTSADLDAADLTSVKELAGNDMSLTWKSVFPALRSSVVLYAKFETELSGVTVKVNGKAAEVFKTGEKSYTIRFTGIPANQFGTPLTITAWNGETQVGKTLTYSLESYAKTALTNDGYADVRPLVSAFAKYCRSVIAYGGLDGEVRIPAFTGDGYLTVGYSKEGVDGFDYNAGHGDWQKTIRDTTASAVETYRGKLAAEGYMLKASNTIGNNCFWTYRSENGKEIIHVNWFPTMDDGNYTLDGELHPDTGVCNIIACQGDEFIPSAEETAYTVKNPTTLIQPSRKAVDVNEDGDDSVAVGLSLVFQLADGRYIIVDGGPLQDAAKGDEDTLYKYLSDHAPKGEKPTIALWIGTHPHGDHVWLVDPFLQKYHDKVNLEMIAMNYPDVNEYQKHAGDNENMYFFNQFKKTAEQYYPDLIFWKMHSGDALRVADALIEVVFTHEDLASVYGIYTALGVHAGDVGKDHIQTSNELSTCFRLTIHGETVLCMGDSEHNATLPFFNSYNGTDELKVDIFQIPHHASWGNNYLDRNCCLYNSIDPKIVVYSVGPKLFVSATMDSKNGNREANKFMLGTLDKESETWSWSLDAQWHRGEESGTRVAFNGGYKGEGIFQHTFPTEE